MLAQSLKSAEPGWTSDDLGMHGQHELALLGVQSVELGGPGLQYGRGRLHGPARQRDRILKKGSVVEDPGERELNDVSELSVDFEQVRRIVIKKVRRVLKAILLDQLKRYLAELSGRGAIACRLPAA